MGDELDDVWDRLGGADPGEGTAADEQDAVAAVDLGPPLRVTFVIRADKVPVAPWAQGWRVGTIGPEGGHVTIVCEHEIDLSPVAQLSAVTGLLGTVKQAQLDLVWWTIQARGPIDLGQPDIDSELSKLLDRDPEEGGGDPADPR